MAYIGKYVDRNPCIKTAGIMSQQEAGAGDVLKIYSMEEAAENIVKAKCKFQEKTQRQQMNQQYPFIPSENIKDILSTEAKKTRFVAFREKFSEDMYFKKPELGKVYPLHSKPDDINNDNTTFGDKIIRSEGVYNIILPRKTPEQVQREYLQWHDKYILSHKHYYPSEQINRHYNRTNYNPDAIFGIKLNADITGRNVRRCMKHCDRLIVISKPQKDFLERTNGRLGKQPIKHNFTIPDITFGIASVFDKCGVQALMENIDPCVKQTKLIDAISHIHKLRRTLFECVDFHMFDLHAALEFYDEKKTGFLTLPKIFDIMRMFHIRLSEEKIRTALEHMNILRDAGLKTERVCYDKFWELLQLQYPMPNVSGISTVPNNFFNKDTTYRDLCKDREKKPIEAKTGTSKKFVRIQPKSADNEVTTAKDVIQPDIPMHCGLGPSDFAAPRSKEQLRRIFKRVLTEKFDEVWERARVKSKDPDELISVDELRTEMNIKVIAEE